MKKTVLTLAACAFFLFGINSFTFAQLKVGYIDSQEILKIMPERDSAAKVYEKFSQEIQKNYESMTVTFQNLQETFNKQKDSLSTFIRTAKEQELQDMIGKIQNFQQVAQQELDKRQQELMNPIMDKLKKTIKAVAEANKFTYVIDVTAGGLMYYPEDESLNLATLVKAKLGIK